MKPQILCLVLLLGPIAQPAAAAQRPAYAVLRAGSIQDRVVIVRYPNLPQCRRELPSLVALLTEALRSDAAARPGIISPELLETGSTSKPVIIAACHLLRND